jgi:penicillin-binding protein 1B
MEKHQALDPRVAYLMTNLMEEVLRSGTAAGVRGRYGFLVPAAGKTGTSDRDGWFAGYTSQLLCVVWVGFDDSRDLDLQGAYSAAPIWAEFMRRALSYREYRDAQEFRVPNGIVTLEIDPASGMPATPNCPKTQTEVYIAGTEPVGSCPLHGGRSGATNVAGWDSESPARAGESGAASGASQIGAGEVARRAARQTPPDTGTQTASAPAQNQDGKIQPKQKKGLLRRLLDVIK